MKISKQNISSPLRDEFEQQFSSEELPYQKQFIQRVCQGLDTRNASELEDRWMIYVAGEYKESCWEWFLKQISSRNLKTAKKVNITFTRQRQKYSHERQKEWAQYVPWMNKYFTRNQTHSLGDARRACAANFGVSFETIKRHTKGFKKPKA